jgi:flagellar basal body-associated protein FliL
VEVEDMSKTKIVLITILVLLVAAAFGCFTTMAFVKILR